MREEYEEKIEGFQGVREISSDRIYNADDTPKEDKVIASFENECVRLSELFVFDEADHSKIPFIPEIVILDCSSEVILGQIIEKGIKIKDKEFVFYSSSANQQKKKQVCLMEKKFYEKHRSRFMCGLSFDIINEKGGCNTGKILAYTSLIFSKSVEPEIEINIDDVLVLSEFETEVTANVNFLSIEDNLMEEREMPVPVNHMDGAGIFLPGLLPCSAQIRGGWIKGCVFPFDFRQFIIENQSEGKIQEDAFTKDAYGNKVSINYIRDNIKMILNTSQLKMWKYYDSWDDYKRAFEEAGLKICINNTIHYPEDDDPIVQSAYQFEQTIPRDNVSAEKIEKLAELTINTINDAKTDPDKALKLMGINTEKKTAFDPFSLCIKMYPQMLQDVQVKKRIGSRMESIRKRAMGGKPFIRGFYSYICPDLYAACEYWFCNDKEPKGLIPANSVYNSFYCQDRFKDEVKKIACLRSPHLSDCEHGIRNLEKSAECQKWFPGMDTVISTHDLLTKTLQADVDGDEVLCVHDSAFIDLLDKNKLPLYYEMQKGADKDVNNKNIFECLHNSFENSVIGEISNALTKHLNAQEESDLRFVRFMTAYNNFVIDNPKSQYMPELPEKYQEMFQSLKEAKFPYFFKYAKNKKSDACEQYRENEKSTVNRISKYIQNKIKGNKDCFWNNETDTRGKDKFNPQYFQSPNNKIRVDRSSEKYKDLRNKIVLLKERNNNRYRKRLNQKYDCKTGKTLGYDVYYHYCNHEIMEQFSTRIEAAAYLLDIEYYQEENVRSDKSILWNCFGDTLHVNLIKNLDLHNDGTLLPCKKLAYRGRSEQEKKIEKEVAEIAESLETEGNIDIYENEYDWFRNLKCRKGSERDRYILFLLIVLYKRRLKYIQIKENERNEFSDDAKKHIKIYNNTRDGKKTTKAMLDKWVKGTVTNKALIRLEKAGAIKIEQCKNYDKIYLKPSFEFVLEQKEIKPIFVVKGGNPMLYYYQHSGEAIVEECEICGKLFQVVGNMKTCSETHSRALELRNKNKK